jgi:hypothetical protein
MTDYRVRKEVIDEGRAAFLLDLPEEQLREISEFSGLGHLEEVCSDLRLVFTYEELDQLCRLIGGPVS